MALPLGDTDEADNDADDATESKKDRVIKKWNKLKKVRSSFFP